MGTDRRADIDRAYDKLMASVFSTIDKLSEEHPKTPRSVILFGAYQLINYS